jgi:hypothetical protein
MVHYIVMVMKPLRVDKFQVFSILSNQQLKSISSSAAQYVCDPAKMFFTSKFSYLSSCNPTHKTETGTANKQVRGVLIANHLDQSLLWWVNQKHSSAAVRLYSL